MVIWIVALAILCTVAGFFLGFVASQSGEHWQTARLLLCQRVPRHKKRTPNKMRPEETPRK